MYKESNEKYFVLLLKNSNCTARSFSRIWRRELAGRYCGKKIS